MTAFPMDVPMKVAEAVRYPRRGYRVRLAFREDGVVLVANDREVRPRYWHCGEYRRYQHTALHSLLEFRELAEGAGYEVLA